MSTVADLLAKKDDAVRRAEHYRTAALRLLRADAPIDQVIAMRHAERSTRAEIKLREKAIEHARTGPIERPRMERIRSIVWKPDESRAR